MKKIITMFSRGVNHLARLALAYEPIDIDHNFCAIAGTVGGYNSAGQGVLTFAPRAPLDANRLYYVIIKGDDDLTISVKEGVKNIYGVSMDGPHNEMFNAQSYSNSFIWSFRPGDEICQLNSVKIEPASYLFNRSDNDSSDDGPGALYDTINDSDKEFTATPLGARGTAIAEMVGYYEWTWIWRTDNEGVARVSPADSPRNVVVAQNRTDARTVARATAQITLDNLHDGVTQPKTEGQSRSAAASIYVFICENPWPPRPASGVWSPWQDQAANCTPGLEGADCDLDNNMEFYYCRDAGRTGTADDLPAIYSAGTIVRGQSTGLSCSDGSGVCVTSADCDPGGTCVPNILKEFYFLREAVPSVASEVLVIRDMQSGNSVQASWSAIPEINDYNEGYKLYWGTASRNYRDYIEIPSSGAKTASNIDCSLGTGNIINCMVTGLTINTDYYFAFTSFLATSSESDYSNEVTVRPTDQTPPGVPQNLTAAPGDRRVILKWDAVAGAAGYKVYIGTTAGSYGTTQDVRNTTQAIVDNLTNGRTYYFTVTAYDQANNESGRATEANATPES